MSQISGDQLLGGILNRDAAAPGCDDYHTLAEDYDVEEAAVDAALDCLRWSKDGHLPLEVAVHYHPEEDMRPVQVRCWTGAGRVAEELEEAREQARHRQ